MFDRCVFEADDLLERISTFLNLSMFSFSSSSEARGQPHSDRMPLQPPWRYSEQKQK
jgi:hypothetical protein